ncbi:alpha/beta hydrolase family protein [Streptomyces sp. WM6378]|uniref:alpha/beta hydrolase family protein n=1 Tax=Streptomyces sp. WM6378 TaxID=1415557 RepID=UPI0006B03C1C|nr:alpha/beta hydrolase [Streptomyces sp. WM6378]
MNDRSTVSYGPEGDQVADLAVPAGATGPVPLVVLLHGGFWRDQYDRHYLTKAIDSLTGDNIAVANVEYRRTGAGGGWPTTFTDVAQALDVLPALFEREHPGRVDLDRVVYVGHSAGGQLGLWAALRHRLAPGTPGWSANPAKVAGVVALAAVADMAESHRLNLGEGAVAHFLGGGPEDVPERYAAADPAGLGELGIPVFLVHGELDEMVPVSVSRSYQAAAGGTLIEVPGASHVDVVRPGSAAWPAVQAAVHHVLDKA